MGLALPAVCKNPQKSSSPPKLKSIYLKFNTGVNSPSEDIPAPIAQLDRATDYESVCREFESLWARHDINNLATPKRWLKYLVSI